MPPPNTNPPAEQRFCTSRRIVFIDQFMHHFIRVGGISIILAVCGIFVFIVVQTLPLFRSATVTEYATISVPPNDYAIMGVDPWGELPFLADTRGNLHFVHANTPERAIETVRLRAADRFVITALRYDPHAQQFAFGADQGQFGIADLKFTEQFDGAARTVTHHVEEGPTYIIGKPGYPIRAIEYADAGDRKLAAAIQEVDGKLEVHAAVFRQKKGLVGSGTVEVGSRENLRGQIKGQPRLIRVNAQAEILLVSTTDGAMYYFQFTSGKSVLMQVFHPFGDLPGAPIDSMNFLFGGVSVVLTTAAGDNRMYSLFVPERGSSRLFSLTKTLPALPGPATYYAASLRNKSFLLGTEHHLSLRHATTESIRFAQYFDVGVRLAALGSKYDRLLVLDQQNNLRLFHLADPHPESGWNSYFGKLWYEGAAYRKYEWQSTGGTDDYEPKLSLVPLIVGTLKGTLYAMIFAAPLALLAALYTSQFLHWKVRLIVKPTMEIMASLPSVVLGFLAALWLAPIIELHIVFIFVTVTILPFMVLWFGAVWRRFPTGLRARCPPGHEFLVVCVLGGVVMAVCWLVAPWLEQTFCVIRDPDTGARLADFRLWWPQVTGTRFEQRNAVVVGFVMGFAVIPIIFTIAEESLSNVPQVLTSGALALGASRWQMAIRVALPTAAAGIFSALMVGLGRAVGETMIVLMATGNTPIMDFSPFTGMRTLSANIAVELPEAPHGGTLYRTLFLGALLLFMFTFVLNTFAELLRQHLREKYKTI